MMYDGNTAARLQHEREQDMEGNEFEMYEDAARMRASRRASEDMDALMDLFLDDVPAAMEDEYEHFVDACRRAHMPTMGMYVYRALERCIDRLVTEDMVQDEAAKMAREERE